MMSQPCQRGYLGFSLETSLSQKACLANWESGVWMTGAFSKCNKDKLLVALWWMFDLYILLHLCCFTSDKCLISLSLHCASFLGIKTWNQTISAPPGLPVPAPLCSTQSLIQYQFASPLLKAALIWNSRLLVLLTVSQHPHHQINLQK